VPGLPKDGVALWRHQEQLIELPKLRRDIEFFFMVAGYGSGKSFAGVMLIIDIAEQYQGKHVFVGVGGGTITLLRKTLLADLFRICMTWGVAYAYNKNEEIVTIGTVSFVIISTENAERIYAYNFSIFICDEIDELPQVKALEAFKAIQERTRIMLPDGRVPFSVFMTTAQGYRGTYQIVSELKERGIPYRLIHGKTADNLALPRAYVKRLYSIYNEVERLVFLEGRFANLTTGRVYYAYDEAKHMLKVQPFQIESSDIVKIGQDLNVGYSRGCAVVKRDGTLHVIRRWSFAEIGHAPKIIRASFPQNEIRWYPDASGNEIIGGYAAEVRQANIKLRLGSVNPSVIDRIFFVNKLFEMGRLYLWPGCGPLSMALKVRQYNDAGDPEKGKGPEAPDHDCDSLEYVIWRIVCEDRDFFDLWRSSREGRAQGGRVA
jgi:hypothetical protein